jgi:uncharacterized protein (DUF924 family)
MSFRTMSGLSTAETNEIDRVFTYWFEDGSQPLVGKWIQGGPKVDAEIKEQFGDLIDRARMSRLGSWTDQPRGTLALIIILDQFSRNIYRGSSLSHSHDGACLEIATRAIAKGYDLEVPLIQQPFFYLPLMHDESLISQIAALALSEGLVSRCQTQSSPQLIDFAQTYKSFSQRHLNTILRFGRYPSRNSILGRESTPEETKFLEENPVGF